VEWVVKLNLPTRCGWRAINSTQKARDALKNLTFKSNLSIFTKKGPVKKGKRGKSKNRPVLLEICHLSCPEESITPLPTPLGRKHLMLES
jgi:hypothetical protein